MRLFRIRIFAFFFIGLITVYRFAAFGYSNPALKILLFTTSKGVILESSKPLTVDNISLKKKEQYRFQVNKLSSSKLILNNRIVHRGSLWVRSTGNKPIRIRKRGYQGTIEIKPYAKGLYIINHLDTENYLAGVLNAEISSKWPLEAIKAQAIIARTFALYKQRKRKRYFWHLYSDQRDQVYLGVDIADKMTRNVLEKTFGLVVTYNNHLVPTFYHSNCGGVTEDPGNIWQYELPYLESKASPYGKNDPKFYWSTFFTPQQLIRVLLKSGFQMQYLEDIFVGKRTTSNRAANLVFIGNDIYSLPAAKFRKNAGYRRIRSLLFNVEKRENGYYFKGTGSGHGVGLCQWGAKDMAERGLNYWEILQFYFKDIEINTFRG